MALPVTVARRYAPFLILAAVQVLLVAVVPSTGGPAETAGPLSAGPGAGFAPDGTLLDEFVADGSGPGAAAGGPGALRPTGPGGVGGRLPTGRLTEDRSKCAPDGLRQQNVTIASPPCVPRFEGDNGGATYQGVTAETVKVLRYRPEAHPQVEAILRTQGLAATDQEEEHAERAFAKFFEKHYEFYNRRVEWIWEQGTCTLTPPDAACLRDEARTLNNKHRPFAVYYTTSTVQGEFFDEWSRQGVVNIGGWHFHADFNRNLRPYHWDVFMDGTNTARNLGDYWCKKMQGRNATLAGDPTMRSRQRKVGVITQNFDVTRRNANDFVAMVRGGMCGAPSEAADPFFTPSDITTAQQTANTVMSQFRQEGVTTVVMLSDPIGPRFFTQAATAQTYYPEHLLAGSGLIDYDLLGRLYDPAQWVNAFGPGHLPEPIPFKQSDASRAAADVGESEVYSGANLLYAYMSLAAAMVQMAGPNLNPLTVERGMTNLPAYGGWERTRNPASVLVRFGPGNYTAIEDARHAWWNPNATSKIDGKPGAYIAVEGGRRWEIGRWAAGEPKQ